MGSTGSVGFRLHLTRPVARAFVSTELLRAFPQTYHRVSIPAPVALSPRPASRIAAALYGFGVGLTIKPTLSLGRRTEKLSMPGNDPLLTVDFCGIADV